tara:strand:+ start:1961 stop:2479 length:519 start_codon:yes stop_codon:yes gene_type:complete
MAHFAEVNEDNIVVNVIVVGNEVLLDENGVEQESLGVAFLNDFYPDSGTWIQTSYWTIANEHKLGGTPLRGNYAGIGMRYNPDKDRFECTEPPLDYPSFTFDEETAVFTPPTEQPGTAWWYQEPDGWVKPVEPPWHRGWDDNNGWDVGTPDLDNFPGDGHYWDGDKEEWIAI